jgi:hypothetical protein
MASFVRVQEVEHAIGPTGRFALRVTSSDVEIRGVSGPNARVRIEFDLRAGTDAEADEALENVKFITRSGDGFLEIQEPKRGDQGLATITRLLGMSGVRVEARVIAEVPQGATVAYNTVSGDLIGIGLTGEQEYRTVSGDLVLSDTGGAIRVNGVSSDISLRAEHPISLEANTVSGDLSIIAPRIETSRVVTVSGDVELEADLGSGHPHRIETVSGDLNLGAVGGLVLEVRGLSTDVEVNMAHRSEGSRDRRRFVIGDGAASVQFSSMSGDVSVGAARRIVAAPRPATPATPPTPPTPLTPPTPPKAPRRLVSEDDQLEILRALERGEIDIDEAQRRLAGEATDA